MEEYEVILDGAKKIKAYESMISFRKDSPKFVEAYLFQV